MKTYNTKYRLLAIILGIVLIYGCFPFAKEILPYDLHADSIQANSFISREDIDFICQRQVFSNGRYWTYDYTKLEDSAAVYNVAAKKNYTASDVRSGPIYMGSCYEKKSGGLERGSYCYRNCIECFGFAEYIGFEISKISPHNSWKKYTKSQVEASGGLRVGDLIRYDGHSAIVLSVDGENFTVVECLGSSGNRINYDTNGFNSGKYKTLSEMKSPEIRRYIPDSVSSANELMDRMNEAAISGKYDVIPISGNVEIDLNDYINQYPNIITEDKDSIMLCINNCALVEGSESNGTIRFIGNYNGKVCIIENRGAIRLGTSNSPISFTNNFAQDYDKNGSWFSGVYPFELHNYGSIYNCSFHTLYNFVGGEVGYFQHSMDTNGLGEDDSIFQHIVNKGKILTLCCCNKFGSGHPGQWINYNLNYGDIGDLIVLNGEQNRTQFINYGNVGRLWSKEKLSSQRKFNAYKDLGDTGEYYQYGGELAEDLVDSGLVQILGGVKKTGSMGYLTGQVAFFSITLNGLPWVDNNGIVEVYTPKQEKAVKEIRELNPTNEYKWFGADGCGHITFTWSKPWWSAIDWSSIVSYDGNSNPVMYSGLFTQLLSIVAFKVVDCVDDYSLNLYLSGLQLTNLPSGTFRLHLNNNRITYGVDSQEDEKVYGHYEFDNGSIQINKSIKVLSPDTLVFDDIDLDVSNLDESAFECDNGHIIFKDCSSMTGKPIELDLHSSTDIVEIYNLKPQIVEYVRGQRQPSDSNPDFIIKIGDETNGVTEVADGSDTMIYSSLLSALQNSTSNSYNLFSDAKIESLLVPNGTKLNILDNSTITVDKSAVIDGDIQGIGTIDIEDGANLIFNGNVSDTVTINDNYDLKFDIGKYAWVNVFSVPLSTKNTVVLPEQKWINASDVILLKWKNSETGEEYDPGSEIVICSDTTFVAIWKSRVTPTPAVSETPTVQITLVPIPTNATKQIEESSTVIPEPTKKPAVTATVEPTVRPNENSDNDQTPESTNTATFDDFVERLYTVAMGRNSDEAGKQYWTEQVKSGVNTGADCARGFLLSQEFHDKRLNSKEFLGILYKTFFDREPDEAGMVFWLDLLQRESQDVVIECFIDSAEWCDICATYGVKSGATTAKATKASANSTEFAKRLYKCCLNREPEDDGLKYWSLALTNLEVSGMQAAAAFFDSPEFIGFNTDNHEYLVRLYRTFMGREPDDDGINYWEKQLNNGISRNDVFIGFVGSPEFTNICSEYGIDRGEFA